MNCRLLEYIRKPILLVKGRPMTIVTGRPNDLEGSARSVAESGDVNFN